MYDVTGSPDYEDEVTDLAFKDVVGEQESWLELPSPEELACESANDPTFPVDESGKHPPLPKGAKRGPKLSDHQQMQIAIWIVEGLDYRKAKEAMAKSWGFFVTESTYRYYRMCRQDLMDKAASFVNTHYTRAGLSLPGVRMKRLSEHLELLEQYRRENGLFEADVHLVSTGRGQTDTVTSKKFAAALSKEIRETMKQIDQMDKSRQESLANAPKGRLTIRLEPEAQERFLEAASWSPGGEEAEEKSDA